MATNTLTADSRIYDFEFDGDPNGIILGDQGDRCAHMSLGIMYLKTGGLSRQGWVISTTGEQPVVSVNGQTGIVNIGKADVGLSEADNTSDADKPLSNASVAALATKQDLVERGQPDGYASLDEFGVVPADQLPTIIGVDVVTSVNGEIGDVIIDKFDIGLGQVDNTGDLFKPISNATQTALNAKQALAERGQVNGYAPLGADGKVPAIHMPELSTFAPVTSVNGEIGDVVLVKGEIGLGNVDNTSDAAKPV